MSALTRTPVLLLLLAACGAEPAAPPAPLVEVRGAAIDGSDDPAPAPPAPVEPADEPRPDDGQLAAAALVPAEGEGAGASSPAAEEASEEVESEPEPAGPRRIGFRDLSLIDFDVDAMLDYRLFPEEYEGEDVSDLAFPPEIAALDGAEVSLVGYMIPGKIEKGGDVRDFMLVRDLLGCCFGGTPMPDEWVDVVVAEDTRAEYRAYLPMRVTGVMTLGGEQDEAGFALGIYRMTATAVQPED